MIIYPLHTMIIYQLRGTYADDHPDHHSKQVYYTKEQAQQAIPNSP